MLQPSGSYMYADVPSMSQFMMKSSFSCLEYRAAVPLSTVQEKEEDNRHWAQ